ncbi:DUF5707 domain-containing protein [Streptomyces sp. cmx-18-6]|uniref:DUF5707 domain-containing protein n=1 Tax=Streptomyces sp. cmx-18-6 TaxID=2790930 RepID=UPI00398069DE
MSKRAVVVSALTGVALLGGTGAYAADAAKVPNPAPRVTKTSNAYIAPTASKSGSLTFTARVTDDSGIRGLRVLAYPDSRKPRPTIKELIKADAAGCKVKSAKVSDCKYKRTITRAQAVKAPGTWRIAVLVVAKDGGKTFLPSVSTFKVK